MKDRHRASEAGPLNDAGMELSSPKLDGVDKSLAVSHVCQCHQGELERLKTQVLELETSLHTAEETYKRNLSEKVKEISSLTQLSEEVKESAEEARSTLAAVTEERDQLLYQVKELDVLAELRARVQELESSLAEAEKQRGLDYESQRAQHNLLTEQIHSLSIEAKSKDVKIEALQRELDGVQLQFCEQGTQMKTLQSQLEAKEREVREGTERLRDISQEMEGLSQALSQKELEIAKMDQLLLEKQKDVETLQQTIQEKDQQVTELSFSMTEKMVQLNEEKFSLGVEIKTLKEQLNLLSRTEEATKEQVEESGAGSSLKLGHDESGQEGLQQELELLRKESEQKEKQGLSKEIKNLQTQLTALQEEGTLGVYHAQLQQKSKEISQFVNNTLQNTMETERQESKTLMEKVELEVAERKLSFHNLQEEMHQLQGQLERAGQAQADLETQYSALQQRHKTEMEEKTACILSLQKNEQELQSACAALKEENSKLLQEKHDQAAESAQAMRQLEDQLQQKSKEISQFVNKPNLQKNETASQLQQEMSSVHPVMRAAAQQLKRNRQA